MRVAPSLKRVLRVAYARFEGFGGPPRNGLRGVWIERCERIRRLLERGDAQLAAALRRNRRLYGALGLDPSKDRPEPERLARLLRRGRLGEPEPAGTQGGSAFLLLVRMASLSAQCMLDAYDLDRIQAPVTVRLGKRSGLEAAPDEEPFGRLVLADRAGVFGTIGRRSGRACLTDRAKRALVVAWIAPDHPRAELESAFRDLAELAERELGARPVAPVLPEDVVVA